MQAITHRRVLNIALPIMVSNVTIPLLGLVDTAVVGQIGSAIPIGAVGLGSIILSTVYMFFGFLRMGTSGLAAQAFGSGDHQNTAMTLHRALFIAALCGLTVILLKGPILASALTLSPASTEVEHLAEQYVALRIWGAPATVGLYAITGWLIALERARSVLLLHLCINLVNIVLDLAFVIGLDLGVPGVAAASLIGEWLGFCLALYLCRDAFTPALRSSWSALIEKRALRDTMAMNVNLVLRSVLLQFSFTSFVFLSAGQGDISLAANQVLLQFLLLFAYILDAFAYSAEALVGQAVGARAAASLRRATLLSGQWALFASLCLTLAAVLGGPSLIYVLTSSPEVREAALRFLPWIWLFPVASFGSYIFDGIFIGATLSRDMRNVMAIAIAIYVAVLAVMLPLLGNHALWLALISMNLARTALMAMRYPGAEAKARSLE